MSTHSALGIRRPDGSIIGCYVHFDGYPSHMEEAIEDYLLVYTMKDLLYLIEQAQDVGGIRSFHSQVVGCSLGRPADARYRDVRSTELFSPTDDPYHIDESNWSDDHMSTYAWYLIDEATGELETRLKYPDAC